MASTKHATQASLTLFILFTTLIVVQIGAQSNLDLDRIESVSFNVEKMRCPTVASIANHFIPSPDVKPAELEPDSSDANLEPSQTQDQYHVGLVSSTPTLIVDTVTATTTATANLVPRSPAVTLTVLSTQYLSNSAHFVSVPESTDAISSSNPSPSLEPNPSLTFFSSISSSPTDDSTLTSYPSIITTSPTVPILFTPIITDLDSDPNTTNNPDDSSSMSESIASSIPFANTTDSTVTTATETMLTSISTHVSYVTVSASISNSDTDSAITSYTSTSTVTIHPTSSASSSASSSSTQAVLAISRYYMYFTVAIGLVVMVLF